MIQGADFGIHLRLKKLNGFSAIAAVAVNIGDDFLQVNDYGSLSVQVPHVGLAVHDYYPDLPEFSFPFGGLNLYYDIDDYGTSTYKIELPTEDGEDHYIAIDTFNAGSVADNPDVTDEKETASMSVRIHGHGNVFSGSKGLCGDWDQTTPGFYDRNGVVMTIPNAPGYTSFYDATAFGNEWRVGVGDEDDPDLLISNDQSNNLNPSEWGENVCVEQGARRRILQDAKRKLDQCSKCDDLESSGAPQVQVDWCNYDAVALSCDFVSNAPMYDQSNPMFASLYKADCAGCGGGEIIHILQSMTDFFNILKIAALSRRLHCSSLILVSVSSITPHNRSTFENVLRSCLLLPWTMRYGVTAEPRILFWCWSRHPYQNHSRRQGQGGWLFVHFRRGCEAWH